MLEAFLVVCLGPNITSGLSHLAFIAALAAGFFWFCHAFRYLDERYRR